eukprot:TRINITY_DN3475_c0_g1_i1.p1 TRINITY_DN3475_c0_g1~~TRINITY_DN3475_c0_g1_i1.p1  ORF type:complete len:409 (-),score=69.50 TRINITY_DN3475_c0_g1_i1:76-1302(-)
MAAAARRGLESERTEPHKIRGYQSDLRRVDLRNADQLNGREFCSDSIEIVPDAEEDRLSVRSFSSVKTESSPLPAIYPQPVKTGGYAQLWSSLSECVSPEREDSDHHHHRSREESVDREVQRSIHQLLEDEEDERTMPKLQLLPPIRRHSDTPMKQPLQLPHSIRQRFMEPTNPDIFAFSSAPYLLQPIPEPTPVEEKPDSLLRGEMFNNIDEKPSRLLYVCGLVDKDINARSLYNVFSNFGNIGRIFLLRGRGAAFVEYETAEFATLTKVYLHNLFLLSSQMRIFYSVFENLGSQESALTGLEEDDIFCGSPKTHRFRESKSISINPPSDTIHVSNLVPEACTTKLLALFEQYGRILNHKFIHMAPNRHMCLIRLATIDQALTAMAFLHDYVHLGRNFQISFTRSKI